MKKTCFVILLMMITVYAHSQFSEPEIIDFPRGLFRLLSADLNDNGVKEIVSTNRDTVITYEMTEAGDFNRRYINIRLEYLLGVFDMNNDNKVDIVGTNKDSIFYFTNLGVGEFDEESITISRNRHFHGCYLTIIEDFDGDSDLDVIYVDKTYTLIGLINDGSGQFEEKQLSTIGLMSTPRTLISMKLVDYNDDGFLDVIYSEYELFTRNNPLKVVLNNGRNSFEDDPFSFGKDAFYVYTNDMNNDGKRDIVSRKEEEFQVYYNKSEGDFSDSLVFSSFLHETVDFGDFDNDGDLDIFGYGPWDLYMYENKNGRFEDGILFHRFAVSDGFFIKLIDLDNDFDLDIVFSSFYELAWQENMTNQLSSSITVDQPFYFTVTPNPVSEVMNVTSTGYKRGYLSLHNVQGKQLWVEYFDGQLMTTVTVDHLPNGIYFLKMQLEEQVVQSRKIVISR